jgi:hypothetical protein
MSLFFVLPKVKSEMQSEVKSFSYSFSLKELRRIIIDAWI